MEKWGINSEYGMEWSFVFMAAEGMQKLTMVVLTSPFVQVFYRLPADALHLRARMTIMHLLAGILVCKSGVCAFVLYPAVYV